MGAAGTLIRRAEGGQRLEAGLLVPGGVGGCLGEEQDGVGPPDYPALHGRRDSESVGLL